MTAVLPLENRNLIRSLDFLSFRDVARVARVNKQFYNVMETVLLIKGDYHVKKLGNIEEDSHAEKLGNFRRVSEFREEANEDLTIEEMFGFSPVEVTTNSNKIELWKEGAIESTLEGHVGNVKYAKKVDDLLFSCDDTAIKIWDVYTKQCLRTIDFRMESSGETLKWIGFGQRRLVLHTERYQKFQLDFYHPQKWLYLAAPKEEARKWGIAISPRQPLPLSPRPLKEIRESNFLPSKEVAITPLESLIQALNFLSSRDVAIVARVNKQFYDLIANQMNQFWQSRLLEPILGKTTQPLEGVEGEKFYKRYGEYQQPSVDTILQATWGVNELSKTNEAYVWDAPTHTMDSSSSSISSSLQSSSAEVDGVPNIEYSAYHMEEGKAKKRFVSYLYRLLDEAGDPKGQFILHNRHIIYSSAWKRCIRVFDLDENRYLESVIHLNQYANYQAFPFVMTNREMITASDDETIKIWDLGSGKCVDTLKVSSRVKGLIMHKDRLISHHNDKMIRTWNLDTRKCEGTVNHEAEYDSYGRLVERAEVDVLLGYENLLISGSRGSVNVPGYIKVWDLRNGKNVSTFRGSLNKNAVVCKGYLIQNNFHQASGSIELWDINTGIHGGTLEKGARSYSDIIGLKVYKGLLISCLNNNTIEIWDLNAKECLRTISFGKLIKSDGAVVSFDINRGYLILLTNQGKVFELNFYPEWLSLIRWINAPVPKKEARNWGIAISPLLSLPTSELAIDNTCLIKVFSFLSANSAANAARVNKQFYNCIVNKMNQFWRTHLLVSGQIPQSLENQKFYELYGKRQQISVDTFLQGNWRVKEVSKAYKAYDWDKGSKGEFILHNKYLTYFSAQNNCVRIFDLAEGMYLEPEFNLKDHGHNEIFMTSRGMITGAASRMSRPTIKIWDLSSGKYVDTLDVVGPVDGLMMHNDRLITHHWRGLTKKSGEVTIRIWNLDTKKCEGVLKEEANEIDVVLAHENLLLSGSVNKKQEGTINVWDLNAGQCVSTVEKILRKNAVIHNRYLIQNHPDFLEWIELWDLDKGERVGILKGHRSDVIGLKMYKGVLFTYSRDNTIKIWDMNTRACLRTISIDREWKHAFGTVNSFVINRGRLVLLTDKGKIFELEFYTPLIEWLGWQKWLYAPVPQEEARKWGAAVSPFPNTNPRK